MKVTDEGNAFGRVIGSQVEVVRGTQDKETNHQLIISIHEQKERVD